MYKFFMGKFQGIPVYKISDNEEWCNSNTEEAEEIYVVEDEVYYHDHRIGYLNRNKQLEDFEEEMFNELRSKYVVGSKVVSKPTIDVCVETRLQEEEKSVKETVGTPDRIVDEFMATWGENIDNEIAMLKSAIAQMEVGLNAVD